MNPVDTVPLMLLALHMLALGVIALLFLGMLVVHHRARIRQADGNLISARSSLETHPTIWLAIHSTNPEAVQSALGVDNPERCPWLEGISGKHEFFIGSPLNNWIIVTGRGLPQPDLDVDRSFHFLVRLSRKVGHVQFFVADPVLQHHAWVRLENGAVKRAYAWAGETVWNQGAKSLAEIELDIRCADYGGDDQVNGVVKRNDVESNVRKVPFLAERWGINPADIGWILKNPEDGVAGKSSFHYQD